MHLFKKKRPKFPTLAAILLVLGVIWFLVDIGIVKIDIPWIPLIIIIVSIGMIFNRFKRG